MKRITTKCLLALGIALGVSLCAQAQPLSYTFDTGPTAPAGFTGWNYVAANPDFTGGALQANYVAAGWNQNAQINFGTAASQNGNANANVDINNMLNTYGFVNVSFDLTIEDLNPPYTYAVDGGNWAAFQLSGNSLSGGGGYVVAGSSAYPSGGLWSPSGDNSVITYAMSYTGTQLGWSSDPGNWFQLIFIANSSGTDGQAFYIDNLTITPIPEPTSCALVGLGAAALLIFRRRK
jgi:hypothetical protein